MGNQGESRKQLNIGITLFPSPDETLNSINARFVKLLSALAKETFVIGGNLPEPGHKAVHMIGLRKWGANKPLLFKMALLLLVQVDTCFNLLSIIRQCDVVILASLGELEVMPLLMAKLFRKKAVIVQGGTYTKTFDVIYGRKWLGLGKIIPGITGLLARITHGLANGIIVDTAEEAEFFGLSRYRNKILICGISYIDTDIFKVKRNLADRRDIVGYIGRFSREKGVINLAKAVPLMLDMQPDIEFLMCGDGPLFDEARKELEVGRAGNKVTLAGRVPLERIPDYLNEMRLLVIPSYLEGLPKILLEAMACGTPVLATPAGGMPRLIKNEETGFILESNSPEHIARDAVKALHHSRLREIAQTARRLIETNYTYEPVVNSWGNAFQELMKGRKKRKAYSVDGD